MFNTCLIFYVFHGHVQKKTKDSSAPKRPMSAYMLWLNSSRDRIKSENPGISVTEILKKAGEMWKQLSKDKKEVIILFHADVFMLCLNEWIFWGWIDFIIRFKSQAVHRKLMCLSTFKVFPTKMKKSLTCSKWKCCHVHVFKNSIF